MSAPSSAEASSVGQEPTMFLQRPSSARSQDVSHVLARTFRDLFMRDAVGSDTVHYLTKSRGGDDDYHERYVGALHKVQERRDRRMAEAAMLERHIMQAQARAMSADERELNRVSSGVQRFPDLGLPPARAHFRSCIDVELLRSHNLICPEDFATEETPPAPPPQEPDVPNYARETMSSSKKKAEEKDWTTESPLLTLEDHVKKSTDSLTSLESSKHSQQLDKSLQMSQLWKSQVTPEEREVNRTDLTNLQARVDYLKNPRHMAPSATPGCKTLIKQQKKQPKEIGIKPVPEKNISKEPSVIFIPSPAAVVFSNYTVGHVYEITLELKNVTTVLRPVRVIPPKSSYFSAGLGQFPGEQGLVAPGMSCHYTIRFAPDSLMDYDDVLTVQTQSRQPMIIPLQGRRPPPVLSLPENIHVGQCLIGGCKVARIAVTNQGGPGRFCVMNRASWPATNFKSVMEPGCVTLPPFEVRPAVFELDAQQMMILEVLFSPDDTVVYSHGLTIVCDNCHVRHFTITGEGQTADCDLVSMEGGLSEAAAGELCDVSAQHLVRFENLNPYTYYQRTVIIRNKANVEVPFSWVVVKPVMKPPDLETEREGPPEVMHQERMQDANSAFSVEPETGILPASASAQFVITYAPPEVKDYHSVLHFILRDVPVPKTEAEKAIQAVEAGKNNRSSSAKKVSAIQDLTSLEVELKGSCEPFSVILQPYAIYIPGEVLVNTAVKRQFRMVNLSISSIVFEWEKCSSSYIIHVEPPVGELAAQGEMEFEVTVTGSEPGKVDHTLLCHVHHLAEPLMLHVEADIKGPQVMIENGDLNFGLIKAGDTVEDVVTLRNLCQVSARWRIQESTSHCLSQEEPEFIFMPPGGELRPLEEIETKVLFTPKSERSVRTVLELLVEEGNESSLAVRAEVQSPCACLLSCELTMSEVYVDVPVTHQVSLLNQTLLATTFEWGQLMGKQASMCSVSMEPSSGILEPRQQLDISVHFTAHQQGSVNDLRLPCFVTGMEKPLVLALSSNVQGLNVTYRTPREDQEEEALEPETLELDFGRNVKLGMCPMRRLIITNKTAITAPFNLQMRSFSSRPPSPPDRKPANFMPVKSQRRALLGKTANLADPLSKSPTKAKIDLSKTLLQTGLGAAFNIVPASGVLQPFGEQVIEVQGYNDMWGEYIDTLICKVEKLDMVEIPVKMGVSGCPLQFQMVAAQPNHQPVLRFGTHASGVRPITRQMRINNTSPFDIRLDWQLFNEASEDEQLLDLVISYGEAFPLRDKKGNEIVPPPVSAEDVVPVESEDATAPKSSLRRYPTEFIPNSLDTTPSASRQVTSLASKDAANTSSNESQPKVISVRMRGHGGQQSTEPYSITPCQVVVPGRGNSCINVSFTPPPNEEVNSCMDCVGFALGYLSLEDKVSSREDEVQRAQGYDVEPMRLDMTAQVKPALLTIEYAEDDGMNYRAAASDLFRNGRMISERHHVCRATLSNQTETPLVFRLLTSDPFQLVELDDAGHPVVQLIQTEAITLRPRQNATVQVAFRVSLDLLGYLDMLESDPDGATEEAQLERNAHERRLHFNQEMIVEFNNNTMQKLALQAMLTIPSLVLSKDVLDFGICYVGQQRELQFLISNPTGSDSYWSATLEYRSDMCTENTFEVTPSKGMLEAHITHVSNSQVLIKVFFTAKHTEDYEATYVFHGMLGEEPRRLSLRGQGSYDGKHEAIVNI